MDSATPLDRTQDEHAEPPKLRPEPPRLDQISQLNEPQEIALINPAPIPERAPNIQGCGPGIAGCECVQVPAPQLGQSCAHSLGGSYGDTACSGGYQCCNGAWRQGQGACGACACVEATGTVGCHAAPPVAEPTGQTGQSCSHSFGGVYGDKACSGSYQCCGGTWQQGQDTCGACVCVEASGMTGCTGPTRPAQSCAHSLGGVYSDLGCSGGYQCCGGAWRQGQGACGACACVEPTGRQGCSSQGSGQQPGQLCFPSFDGISRPLSQAEQQAMNGVTWRSGCPVSLNDLVMLELPHWRFDGTVSRGRLVVAAAVGSAILGVFEQLYLARFPIERIAPQYEYGGDDDASMAANNTSAFNCRRITGGTRYSQHSYGDAIDINPLQNPYVRGQTVLPPAGAAFQNRAQERPGMIQRSGPVLAAFSSLGWVWGGDWSSLKDYQHFSSNGR